MNRIKQTLQAQGRSQKWYASKIGKTENTISLWMQNKIQPRLEDLYKTAELLQVEVAELLVERSKIKQEN